MRAVRQATSETDLGCAHQRSTNAGPTQDQRSTNAASTQHQRSTSAAPTQHKRSTNAAQTQHQARSKTDLGAAPSAASQICLRFGFALRAVRQTKRRKTDQGCAQCAKPNLRQIWAARTNAAPTQAQRSTNASPTQNQRSTNAAPTEHQAKCTKYLGAARSAPIQI